MYDPKVLLSYISSHINKNIFIFNNSIDEDILILSIIQIYVISIIR